MKANQTVLMTGVLTAILTNACCANFNGSDDFNDDLKDPTPWGLDLTFGAGLLTESKGRLEYTTSGLPTGFDLAARPWILNYGSFTQNWEVHIDVNVPLSPFREMSYFLIVFPGTDPSAVYANRFTLDLDQFQDSGSDSLKFHCTVTANATEAEMDLNKTSSGGMSASQWLGLQIFTLCNLTRPPTCVRRLVWVSQPATFMSARTPSVLDSVG